jgi:hypothetical protein
MKEQTAPHPVLRVGPDRVTLADGLVIIEAARPMPDWQVREFTPIPICFRNRKYRLVGKRKAQPPFAICYVLEPWPESYISNSKLFLTYDAETVAQREADRRSNISDEIVRACLLPFYPFLGLLWSGTQKRLMRCGFTPHSISGTSIVTTLIAFMAYGTLGIALVGGLRFVALPLNVIVLLALFVDLIIRYFRYATDDQWAGGFLEWLLPTIPETPNRSQTPSPGFLESVEGAISELLKFQPKESTRELLWAPPLIERELRIALRKQRPVRQRVRMAAGCLAATLFILTQYSVTGAGKGLHLLLCVAALYIVVRAPNRISGIFAAERREQTLGLLFLSGLSAVEIFTSKVLSAALIVFTDLLAITPMLALPFLLGGISFDLFVATVVCWPTLLFFVLSVSLLASALTTDEGAALLIAVVLAIGICASSVILWAVLERGHGSTATFWWLQFCPAYAPWLVFKRAASGNSPEFWMNMASSLAWSILCLTVTAFALSRS